MPLHTIFFCVCFLVTYILNVLNLSKGVLQYSANCPDTIKWAKLVYCFFFVFFLRGLNAEVAVLDPTPIEADAV